MTLVEELVTLDDIAHTNGKKIFLRYSSGGK